MIRVAGENGAGPIKLLQQHDADDLMRPSGRPKGKPEFCPLDQIRRQTVGPADDEAHRRAVLCAPLAQQSRKCRAVEILSVLIEDHNNRAFGNHIGERNRFLDPAALGVVRAAFMHFDDFKVAQAERAAGRNATSVRSPTGSSRTCTKPASPPASKAFRIATGC